MMMTMISQSLHILIWDFIYTKQIMHTVQKLLLFVTSMLHYSLNEVFAFLSTLCIGS